MQLCTRLFAPVLALLLAAGPAAAQVSTEEDAFLDACASNITHRTYSPAKAEECLLRLDENDHALMDRALQKSDIQLSRLMAGMNALKDLGDFYRDAEGPDILQTGLLVRLEGSPCVLCSLQLGPQPDKLYPWVSRYASQKLDDTRAAALDWPLLPPKIQQLMTAFGQSQQAWAGLTISNRQDSLQQMATSKYNELLPPGARTYDAGRHFSTIEAIWPYLDNEQRQRVNDVHERIVAAMQQATAQAAGDGKNAASGRKIEEMSKKFKGLKSGGDSFGMLGKTFDNSDTSGGAPAAGGKPGAASFKLTEAQAAELAPRLQQALLGPKGELADTAIGRETIAFLDAPGGKLKFSVVKMGSSNTHAAFYPSSSEVKYNVAYIEAAMKATNVSAADLLDEKNTAAMAKVTRYVAPTFVHEYEGHQKQTAWAVSKNIPDHYYIGQETEAFSKGALFVLQKKQTELVKGNPWYSLQISESDVSMARTLSAEGTAAVGRSVMYYDVPSREGKAAQNFARYETLKKELTLRALAATANPEKEAALEAKRTGRNRTAELQKEYNAVFPWYKESLKKNAEEAKYFKKALEDVDRQEQGNFYKYVMPDLV
jgi:hypothetical protein